MATSLEHEGPLFLLGERPELLTTLLGMDLPADARVALANAELTQAVPLERRADAVVTIEQHGTVTHAFVVEVHLAIDPEKAFSWPLYLASLHARVRCPTSLVVLAPDAAVAAWARRAIATFGGGQFRPVVLGPDEVPRITSLDLAVRMPELAVLSALVHGDAPGAETVITALVHALARLDDPIAESYLDLVPSSSVGNLVRAALEASMPLTNYEYKSDFAKKYVAQGRTEGREEGREEGRTEGRVDAARRLLLAILEERNLGPSDGTRARVEATSTPELLERWVRTAATATHEEDVFEDATSSRE